MFTLPVSFQTAVGVIVVLKVMAVEDDLAPNASRLVYLVEVSSRPYRARLVGIIQHGHGMGPSPGVLVFGDRHAVVGVLFQFLFSIEVEERSDGAQVPVHVQVPPVRRDVYYHPLLRFVQGVIFPRGV